MKPDPDQLVQALADPTRLRAVVLLSHEPSLCVCELTVALAVSQPKMSRHLAALRAQGIVEDGRVATFVFYRLHPRLPAWARGVVDQLARGLTHSHELAAARRRLAAFPNRPRERDAFAPCGADAASEGAAHAV
ncbi:MAG: metalloregulator ArsR/SmtB family transcription factor [Rhodospirillales bacterium]|nr:metalloregulator ArsR/SmtB family transcription factor [Rhodospirillales bacterium]